MADISPPKGLHRLIYFSRFSPVFPRAEADQDHEIGQIIAASIRNNREAAITGLLLVHQGQFLQALEGPSQAVMTTYSRILQDPRHDSARLIHAGPAAQREFADWNMCARRTSKADDAILATFETRGAIAMDKLTADKALALLTLIRDIQRRTALA